MLCLLTGSNLENPRHDLSSLLPEPSANTEETVKEPGLSLNFSAPEAFPKAHPQTPYRLCDFVPAVIHRVNDDGEEGEELPEDGDGDPAAEEGLGEDLVPVQGHRPHDEGDGDDGDEE